MQKLQKSTGCRPIGKLLEMFPKSVRRIFPSWIGPCKHLEHDRFPSWEFASLGFLDSRFPDSWISRLWDFQIPGFPHFQTRGEQGWGQGHWGRRTEGRMDGRTDRQECDIIRWRGILQIILSMCRGSLLYCYPDPQREVRVAPQLARTVDSRRLGK